MSDTVERAYETHLANIEARTGKSRGELCELLRASGLERHGALRDHLKAHLGMGHGDANAVVHHDLGGWTAPALAPADSTDHVAQWYAGPKAHLRPIHDAVMAVIEPLGGFVVAPKKGTASLRRSRQFAMVGPGSRTRVDLGFNLKGAEGTERIVAQPPGGMCTHQVRLERVEEVDPEVADWLRRAWEAAA